MKKDSSYGYHIIDTKQKKVLASPSNSQYADFISAKDITI